MEKCFKRDKVWRSNIYEFLCFVWYYWRETHFENEITIAVLHKGKDVDIIKCRNACSFYLPGKADHAVCNPTVFIS